MPVSVYNEFLHSLLPGNYALTKSMELTKKNKSGTLWYTKKFLTLYYYVFLSNDIMTTAYQKAVTDIFDNYINSLPQEVRQNAQAFFYPSNDAQNFKSENFRLFSDFASFHSFASQEEREQYYQGAKKYYFARLMNSGGQSGVKKLLKEAVQAPDFVYSHDNINKIILEAAIKMCVRDANSAQKISDNSVKYILSAETTEKACQTASIRPIDETDVIRLNADYPHENPKFDRIESDTVAFIRNERKTLYYYGYFHAKSTGAKDKEFSSLTPVGELALAANSHEFLAIWEHQKIKMISQSAATIFEGISACDNSAESFGISHTPYTDILGFLLRQGSMSHDEYMYIVSRKKHTIPASSWAENEKNIVSNLKHIKEIVNSFNRRGDHGQEDAHKELLKYLLGIADLPVDMGFHPFGVLKFKGSSVVIQNQAELELIYKTYSKLDEYKLIKYGSVFEKSEADLKRRYISSLGHKKAEADKRTKIYWDLYNIHADNFIMLCTCMLISAAALSIDNIEEMPKETVNELCAYLADNFGKLLGMLGMQSKTAIRKEVQRASLALRSQDYSAYTSADKAYVTPQSIARYRESSADDLLSKIKEKSSDATSITTENRERNGSLISLMKSYYMHRFAQNNMLKCECCGNETFITDNGDPYVEFHHLIPFNIAYGPDHFLNLFALCPNCHKKMHFLNTEDKREIYAKLNRNNYMRLDFTQRLSTMRKQNILRSYHLEFLLADNAITLDEYNTIATRG